MAHRPRLSRQSGNTKHTAPLAASNETRPLQMVNESPDLSHVTASSPAISSFPPAILSQVLSPDLASHIAALEASNQDLRAENQRLEKNLKERDTEMAGMREVLCMYDDCSEVELGNMVNSINTRVESLTRNVSRNWVSSASRATKDGADKPRIPEEKRALIEDMIGPQLANALGVTRPGVSRGAPIILQYAWKAVIIREVTKVLHCFSPMLESSTKHRGLNNLLLKVSGEVIAREIQPAYGHWRMITHRYLKAVVRGEDQSIQAYASEALEHCHTVCRMMLKNKCPNDETFLMAFEDELRLVIKDAFRLLTNIQENMISMNYEPFRPLNAETFNGEIMGLARDDEEFEDDRVVCAVGVGLWCWTKESQDQKVDRLPKRIFKKPQVLTEKNLEAMHNL